MNRILRRPSPAMVVAIAALVMSTVGTGYAAGVLPKNSVGTAQLKRNAVVSSRIKDKSVALRDISASARKSLRGATGPAGVAGPAGSAGAAGAKGDKGDAGANGLNVFAAVKSDGTLVNGTPGATATRLGTGSYVVAFAQAVTTCAGTVSEGGVPQPGIGASTPSANGWARLAITSGGGTYGGQPSDHTVLVSTVSSTGAVVDSSFHLVVAC